MGCLLYDPRAESCGSAAFDDRVVRLRCDSARPQHEVVVTQIPKRHSFPSGEAMVARDGDALGFHGERFERDIVELPFRAQDPDVEPALREGLELRLVELLRELERDGRKRGAERPHRGGHELVGRRGQKSDAKSAELAATDAACLSQRAVDFRERPRRLLEQRLPRLGQLHAAVGTRQELDSDLALELLDRATESRLRDVQADGGTAEVQLLGNRDEVAKQAKLGDAYKVSMHHKQVLRCKSLCA